VAAVHIDVNIAGIGGASVVHRRERDDDGVLAGIGSGLEGDIVEIQLTAGSGHVERFVEIRARDLRCEIACGVQGSVAARVGAGVVVAGKRGARHVEGHIAEFITRNVAVDIAGGLLDEVTEVGAAEAHLAAGCDGVFDVGRDIRDIDGALGHDAVRAVRGIGHIVLAVSTAVCEVDRVEIVAVAVTGIVIAGVDADRRGDGSALVQRSAVRSIEHHIIKGLSTRGADCGIEVARVERRAVGGRGKGNVSGGGRRQRDERAGGGISCPVDRDGSLRVDRLRRGVVRRFCDERAGRGAGAERRGAADRRDAAVESVSHTAVAVKRPGHSGLARDQHL